MGKADTLPVDYGELLVAYKDARGSGSIGRSWVKGAACRGSDTDVFFPERGDPVKPATDSCRDCPVKFSCLLDSLITPTGEDFGIRGGLPQRRRQNLRTRLDRELDSVGSAEVSQVANEDLSHVEEPEVDGPIPDSVLRDMAGFILDSFDGSNFPESLAS